MDRVANASCRYGGTREVGHDHVDVLPAPTCSSTQVRAERAAAVAAVERRWSGGGAGGGAVVTASAHAHQGFAGSIDTPSSRFAPSRARSYLAGRAHQQCACVCVCRLTCTFAHTQRK